MGKVLDAKAEDKDEKKAGGNGAPYLRMRTLEMAAKSAGNRGAQQAMENLGYVIIAKDGMLVRLNKDGTEVQIRKLVSHRTRQVEP